MSDYNMNMAIAGLRTTTIPYSSPGPYTISGKLTLPRPSNGSGDASQVVITINQNGSPIYTGTPGADGFETGVNIALNDVITCVTSSSSNADHELNAVKLSLSLYQGGL
jgi:hypothetical protein